ncbi:MAG: rhodanese-like domain-containing protein [Acidimicrobiales bacterium]
MERSNSLPAVGVDTASMTVADILLLDVREDDEWARGHAPTAVHIPMSDVPTRVGELDRARRIVCACRSGNRSGRVTAWLRQHGFDAVNMTGGMQAWAHAGYPIVDDTGRPGAVI